MTHAQRIILLAPDRASAKQYATERHISPVAIATPRSPHEPRGIRADIIIEHPALTAKMRDQLMPIAVPCLLAPAS